MKRMKKKDVLTLSILFCLVSFILPFLIREKNESLLSVLSVSLSAVGTVATLITLFIAIFLYERFGLESRFIGNQTDKVLEVVDYLKGRMIIAYTNKYKYFVAPSRDRIEYLRKSEYFLADKNKIVLMSYDDYNKTFSKLMEIKRSYWLPNKIKKKIQPFELMMLSEIDNPLDEKFIRLSFGSGTDKTWLVTFPEMTYENFIDNLESLVKSVEKWLKQHSDIDIDFKLDEREKYIEDN